MIPAKICDNGPVKGYDLIIWGATGFTGKLVAGYVAEHAPAGMVWAIAGRNRDKLEEVKAALGADCGVEVGESLDRESLDAIVSRTRVVASTVGPFARYGTPLVEACAQHGTDYCDITGEPQWIRGNIDRLHSRAEASGARIVHCCGFDSIPSDLGVWMLHDHLRREHGVRLASARGYVAKIKGGLSGGTIASILNLLEHASSDKKLRRLVSDPYALNPEGERQGPDRRDQQGVRYDKSLGRWTAPFLMAAINTRIVRRSNALLGYPYGREFRYRESTLTGGRLQARLVAAGLAATMIGGSFGPTRWLMRKFLPAPGQGPSAEEREQGRFELRFYGSGEGDSAPEVRGRVIGRSDPGYGETSKMLAESALCLAFDSLPVRGGILTPASCMGENLLARLRAAGMLFEIG